MQLQFDHLRNYTESLYNDPILMGEIKKNVVLVVAAIATLAFAALAFTLIFKGTLLALAGVSLILSGDAVIAGLALMGWSTASLTGGITSYMIASHSGEKTLTELRQLVFINELYIRLFSSRSDLAGSTVISS